MSDNVTFYLDLDIDENAQNLLRAARVKELKRKEGRARAREIAIAKEIAEKKAEANGK